MQAHSQLTLVCRAGQSQLFWSKIVLIAGRDVFKCRPLQLEEDARATVGPRAANNWHVNGSISRIRLGKPKADPAVGKSVQRAH